MNKELYFMQYTNTLDSLTSLDGLSIEFNASTIIALILTAIVSLMMALFGFKLLKIAIVSMGFLAGYVIGAGQIPLLIGDSIQMDSLPLILGLLMATVLGLLATKFYKLVVFIVSFFSSYIACSAVIYSMGNIPASRSLLFSIIAILFSIIVAYLACKFFKPLYIVECSVGGMVTFVTIVALPLELIKSGLVDTISIPLTLIGLVLGIFAAIRQFKRCKNVNF